MKITHRKINAHADIPADEPKKSVKGSVDTGLDYWYFSRHGMGPGTIPRDVQVLDWYEEGYNTWIKLDKMLTTKELNEYELKEAYPPEGSVTHNGEVINACSSIKAADDVPGYYPFSGNVEEPEASELVRFKNKFYGDYLDSYDEESVLDGVCYCVGRKDDEEGFYWRSFTPENWEYVKDMSNEDIYKKYPVAPLIDDVVASTDVCSSEAKKVKETKDDIEYVVSSDEPFVVDYDLSKMDDAWFAKQARKHKAMELADEADAYDLEHGEGEYKDVEGRTLIRYKDYRITPDDLGGWKITDNNLDIVKRGLDSESDAREFIDNIETSTDIHCSVDIDSIDLDVLKKQIEEGCIEYLCGPEGGFKRPGEPREDKWDMYADEMFVVEVEEEPEDYRIKVEVRAELGYSSMENMSMILDPIVQSYDSDAYFEMVEPGIMDAYLYDPKAPEFDFDDWLNSSEKSEGEDIEAATDEDIAEDAYELDEKEPEEEINSEFDFDITVEVDDEGEWETIEGDPLYHATVLDEPGIDEAKMLEDFNSMVEWHVPSNSGKYLIKGKINLVYEYDTLDDIYHFAPYLSVVTDVETSNAGKVESSKEVEAAEDIKAVMTEEDLDRAILEGKPFDLESFKYWKNLKDPAAILAEQVEVGDVIKNSTAEEINNGTVFKVLAINDPAESWCDYTFRVEILEHDGRMQDVEKGTITDLHYFIGDEVGYLVENTED